MKHTLIYVSITKPPDWSQHFEIMCDVRDKAVDVVLGQRKEKKFPATYYASRTLYEV